VARFIVPLVVVAWVMAAAVSTIWALTGSEHRSALDRVRAGPKSGSLVAEAQPSEARCRDGSRASGETACVVRPAAERSSTVVQPSPGQKKADNRSSAPQPEIIMPVPADSPGGEQTAARSVEASPDATEGHAAARNNIPRARAQVPPHAVQPGRQIVPRVTPNDGRKYTGAGRSFDAVH
jgi:hypothetical protein